MDLLSVVVGALAGGVVVYEALRPMRREERKTRLVGDDDALLLVAALLEANQGSITVKPGHIVAAAASRWCVEVDRDPMLGTVTYELVRRG